MKKKIIIAAAFLGLCTNAAYASDNISIEFDGNNIAIEAKVQADSDNAIRVMKKNGNASDKNDIFALKNVTADKDGIVEFEFVMPDEKNENPTDGEYTITVKEKGKTAQSIHFTYVSKNNREIALTKLIQEDASTVVAENSEHYNALVCAGLELEQFHSMPPEQQSEALGIFNASKTEADTTETICDKFTAAVNVSYINNGTANKLTEINPVFEGEKYSEITVQAKSEWIKSFLCKNVPYVSVAALENAYEQANMLYIINTARFDSVSGEIVKYSQALGCSGDQAYMSYISLTGNKKEAADEYITKALSDAPSESASALIGVMRNAVASVAGISSNTGGGGGDSGSSSTGVYSPSIIVGEKNEQNYTTQKGFLDIEDGHWAKASIEYLANLGIVSGNDDGTFAPSRNVTREEYVTMLVKAYNLYDETAECDFEDVPKDSWCYKYVASAVKAGIVAGVDYNKFGLGNSIIRQDMAVMSHRAMQKYDKVSGIRAYEGFFDEAEISEYAKESVKALYTVKVLNGDEKGNFNPQNTATRAEAAIVISTLVKGGE